MEEPEQLAGGLILRRAGERDAEAIVELNSEAFGKWIEPLIRLELSDPERGPGVFTVVMDGDRLVSTLCLLGRTLRLGDVDLPAGQIEYVATRPEYQRRGLVRAQFGWVHRWSAERGELLTMVSGIAYFYRRFGYEYATSLPRTMVPGWGSTPAMPEGMQVRAADRGDLDALIELEHDVHAVSDLVLTRSRRDWEGQLQLAPEQVVWVAVRGSEVRGSMRLWSSEGLYWLIEPAAADLDAARALLAAAVEKVPAGALAVSDRPGTPFAALLIDAAVPIERRTAHYMRVPDPVALLDRIRPLLSRRLAASPFATERGRLMVTLYGTGLAIAYEGGEVTAVEPAPGVEEPGQETVGLPPDVVATLVLGRYGARELARRHDDMWLGHNAALMEVLFPRLRTDLIF